MGRGRARGTAIAGLIGTIALLVGGCGESRHANEQRPQGSTRVSITIGPKELIVQPLEIGTGADPTQQVAQNQSHPQPPIHHSKAPLSVTFVAANQTDTDIQLKIRGAEEAQSETVFAHSPGTFQANLPTGSYVISAVGLPGAQPAYLTVGSYRASTQNDVLLP
jgi:hypothetical protein